MYEAGSTRRAGLPAVLGAMLCTQVVISWCVLALAAVAPMVAETVGLPAILIGYQVSIIYAVGAVSSIFAGSLVARFGGCRISQVALVCCALGAAVATTSLALTIAAASVLIGLAHGLTNPSSTQLLAHFTTQHNRGFVLSLKQTGVPLGGIAAGMATPAIALLWGWQAAIAVLVPVALVLAALLIVPRATWDADRTPGASLGLGALREAGGIVSSPGMRWICVYAFCFGGIQLCVMTFMVVFSVHELGFGMLAGGTLLATVQAAGVIGRIGWGILADRLQNNGLVLALIGVLTAATAIGFALTAPDTSRWMVFALAALFGMSAVGWNGVLISEIVRMAPVRIVGPASGLTTFFAFAGVLAASPAFIRIYAWQGSYAATYAFLALPAILGVHAAMHSAAAAR